MSYTRQSILFISGLDKSVSENMLYTLFNEYPITYIKIAKNHQTKESFGYAFVGFKSHSKAEEAIMKLNYTKLGNKTIRITWYNREQNNFRTHPEYNVFVKKINKNVTHKEFQDYFSKFGNIISARLVEDEEGDLIGYGFVVYDNPESASQAIKEANGIEWKGKQIYVGQYSKNRPKKIQQFNNLYVKNIPKEWSKHDIMNYFSKFGELGSVLIRETDEASLSNLPEDKKKEILSHKFAFICFKNFESAKKVVNIVPYYKLSDEEYNKNVDKFAELLLKNNVEEETCLASVNIIENVENISELFTDQALLEKTIEQFRKYLKDNDGVYIFKDKTNRLECCQALKKIDQIKKLKVLHEKIKKQIKEKYRFCNLYVKNLSDNCDDEALKKLFVKFGEIKSVKAIRKEFTTSYLGMKKSFRVFGFVCFFDPANAREAKIALNGVTLSDSNLKLFVDYHQSKGERADYLKLKMMVNRMKMPNFAMMQQMQGIQGMQKTSFGKIGPFSGNVFASHMLRKFPPNSLIQNMPLLTGGLPLPQIINPPLIMDKNARRDYYGEKLYTKISTNPDFTQLTE